MTAPNYQRLLRVHLAAENAHRMEETLATLTEDCRFEDLTIGKTFYGREGARDYYRLWWDALLLRQLGHTSLSAIITER